MKCNVGGTDRTARMVGGAALLGAGALAPAPKGWKAAMLATGAVALTTGVAHY